MYCKYCGKENKDGDIFCYNCGKKLNENVIMQQSLKQEKKNFLHWIFTGICLMIALAVFVLCVYMFVYKNGGQEQCDNKTLQNAGMKETNDKNEEKISDNNKPSNNEVSDKEKSNSEDIFSKNIEIDGTDFKKEEKIVTKLVYTGLYRDGREVCRVKFNAKASSQLKSKNYFYGVSNLWDLDERTCWVEGVSGYGKGETITYTSKKKQLVSGIAILPGHLKSEDLFYKNSRPIDLDIEIGSKKYYVDCSSFYPYFPIYNIDEYMLYYDFEKPIATKKCVVKIGDIYYGSKYKDTCISEMFFYYNE